MNRSPNNNVVTPEIGAFSDVSGKVEGSLKPTRTIGDLDCKRDLKDIVSPHPELKLTAIYAPPDDGKWFHPAHRVLIEGAFGGRGGGIWPLGGDNGQIA